VGRRPRRTGGCGCASASHSPGRALRSASGRCREVRRPERQRGWEIGPTQGAGNFLACVGSRPSLCCELFGYRPDRPGRFGTRPLTRIYEASFSSGHWELPCGENPCAEHIAARNAGLGHGHSARGAAVSTGATPGRGRVPSAKPSGAAQVCGAGPTRRTAAARAAARTTTAAPPASPTAPRPRRARSLPPRRPRSRHSVT
jgi:hypothetical protein